ncbi:MAG: RNA methyltransferase [Opitutales bacterium]|nr:RNA methyltransferase [Opitutales bacterium]
MSEIIQSRKNPRVLRLSALREDRKAREAAGRFVIEGMRELERAFACKVEIEELYFCPELFRNEAAAAILATARGNAAVEVVELSRGAMEKASYREHPEGLIAVAKTRSHQLSTLNSPLSTLNSPLYLVVEGVEKPGNLGALLRTADSAGCDALIACGLSGDIYNPNTVRASQGTLFSMPFALADKETVAAWLRERGITVFATSPAARERYFDCDFTGPSAILMGTESTGLSDFWLQSDFVRPVGIPQKGLADSLNVSMAAAICLFEALRQREK